MVQISSKPPPWSITTGAPAKREGTDSRDFHHSDGKRKWRRSVVWGATILVGLCFVGTSEWKFFHTMTAVGDGDDQVPEEKAQQDGERIIFEASVPTSLFQELYNDTQHSKTSPLSPNFAGLQNNHFHNQTYQHCMPTYKIQLTQQQSNVWQIHTFQHDGTSKTIGGDEFYVTFTRNSDQRKVKDPVYPKTTHHPTLVAIPTDLNNGTYSLQFYSPPLVVSEWQAPNPADREEGFLTLYLTYTCGMGLVTQKSDWKSRGSLDWVHIQQHVPEPPSWQVFQAPTMPTVQGKTQRLSQYDYVVAFGDSVLGLFVGQYDENPKFNKYPKASIIRQPLTSTNIHFAGNIRRPMVNHTEELQQLFQHKFEKALLRHDNNNAAILLGGGTWDLGIITWTGGDEYYSLEPTIRAYQNFWQWLVDTYPNIPIYWKSLSAMHPHALMDLGMIPRAKRAMIRKGTMYVSNARAQALDQALRQLIETHFHEQIGILDVYHATSLTAEWLFPGDSHHYQWEMNQYMMREWFY